MSTTTHPRSRPVAGLSLVVAACLTILGPTWNSAVQADESFTIVDAHWRQARERLRVEGTVTRDDAGVDLIVRDADGTPVLTARVHADNSDWRFSRRDLDIVPCTVEARQRGTTLTAGPVAISLRPAACDQAPPAANQPPVANADNATTIKNVPVQLDLVANDTDSDGTVDALSVSLVAGPANGIAIGNADGTVSYTPNSDFVGSDEFSYTVDDNEGASSNVATVSILVNDVVSQLKSINSTSQNAARAPATSVIEQALTGTGDYAVFAVNDLGMHCGDLDTRVVGILPPYNVLHAQVVRRGAAPDILTAADGIEVVYSAASNERDPALANLPVLAPDGSLYKTNFWDVARDAYDPFYPPGILAAFFPAGPVEAILDLALPAPDVERLIIGDGVLAADQQAMPGRRAPYVANDPQPFELFVRDFPFFTGFPFGYVARDVNWFEAAGIPVAVFDDAGRENPYPLFRVQARDTSGTVLASVDAVVPVSAEADCKACHSVDEGNQAAVQPLLDAGIEPDGSIDDPQFGAVPFPVSVEYASDVNILRLHDLKHGSGAVAGPKYSPDLTDRAPVICQSCHYTPALDLAQVGPKGAGDADANGREQTVNQSMSRVMHGHHAGVTDPATGAVLFPDMPPPVDRQGNRRDPQRTAEILDQTCYRCHPGTRTQCLRGAMANAGIVCQDCHGGMRQVGNDFTREVSPANPGAFRLAANYYQPDSGALRVPWANEPGCGSCHTGDAMDNLAGDGDKIAAEDSIRLLQAFRVGDDDARPIVPSNKRFAEKVVEAGSPAAGNPLLYRLSKGHGELFCEACHGSTHAEWPNANPNANDNVAAIQLQGYAGTIVECSSCHTGDLGLTLDGPHGMHPVGSTRWNEDHKDLAEDRPNACRACHGVNGEGTVLSRMATDRRLECDGGGQFAGCRDGDRALFPRGHQVGCADCHENEL